MQCYKKKLKREASSSKDFKSSPPENVLFFPVLYCEQKYLYVQECIEDICSQTAFSWQDSILVKVIGLLLIGGEILELESSEEIKKAVFSSSK